jgi:integrase
MAKRDKYHHLIKRDATWHFRKGRARFSLDTTDAADALRQRDRLLENFRLYGHFTITEAQDERPTFGAVVKEWANVHSKQVKYSSWRDYRSTMNGHILPAFKDHPISAITYQEVEWFKSGLDCGAKRINNILVPMRSVFKYAFKAGYVSENVMLKVDNLPVEQPDIFPFSYDEVLKIAASVEPFYRPYVLVRFFTGMRDGEIDGLEWSDYKPEMKPNPKIHINKAFVYGQEGATKTKKSKRYIDCIEPVVEALNDQRALTGKGRYIFLTKDGARMSPDHFRKVVWMPALEKAGLDYRMPLQSRHTFATMMLSSGEVIGWVQNMLGHSSLQMIFTRYYAWIPSSTRKDGSAFMNSVREKGEGSGPEKPRAGGKVIPLFEKSDTKTTQSTKRAHGDVP